MSHLQAKWGFPKSEIPLGALSTDYSILGAILGAPIVVNYQIASGSLTSGNRPEESQKTVAVAYL